MAIVASFQASLVGAVGVVGCLAFGSLQVLFRGMALPLISCRLMVKG